MSKPLIFVSHKHADSKIAKVIGDFIRNHTAGLVDVYLSSDPSFKGPNAGGDLTAELKDALARASLVILVYTVADKDWSYCMWETGVATDPRKPSTKVVTIQCERDAPPPFRNQVRVNARYEQDVEGFVKLLLASTRFFDSPISGFQSESQEIKDAAVALHTSLKGVLPRGRTRAVELWPLLRIELTDEQVGKIRSGGRLKAQVARGILLEQSRLVDVNRKVAQIFDVEEISGDTRLGTLLEIWQACYEDADADWLDTLCDQLARAASGRGLSATKVSRIKEVNGGEMFFPALSRIWHLPYDQKVQFDVYFNQLDPLQVPVKSKMLRRTRIFHKNLDRTPPERIKLKILLNELRRKDWHRVPFLNKDHSAQYMVHRSMMDKFVMEKVLEDPTKIETLTFADLLENTELRQMFETTFAVVDLKASIGEAKQAMESIPGCRDVFVTRTGERHEPVIGWLTNLMLETE